MKQLWACQPRAAKSASASVTPAWIFSAVMPGGSPGSAKSTVAGSRPTNTTRFMDPPVVLNELNTNRSRNGLHYLHSMTRGGHSSQRSRRDGHQQEHDASRAKSAVFYEIE